MNTLGYAALRIMSVSMKTKDIRTISLTTLRIMTLSKTTLSIVISQPNYTQQKAILYKDTHQN